MEAFNWEEFLEREGGVAVPEELFEHVERSLFNGIKPGMLLEVAHKTCPDVYWIAEIGLVCGHLLRVKFIGADADFWCDITTAKVHPLGWCGKYEEPVEPPGEVYARHGDAIIELMKRTLLDGVSASEEALANKGLSPVDRIARAIKLEVQSALDPYRYWIATVCDNVGGRLLLRYDGAEEDLPRVWLFHSSPRLCAFGFVTNKGSPWQFKYPGKVNRFSCKSKLSAQLRLCAEESIKDPTPADLFQPKLKTESHNFIQGMKLEALDPKDMKSVRPATVVKVFNSYHFLVVIDDHLGDYEDTKMAWLCDLMHPYIFPVNWAASTSMPFTEPKIWDTSNEFDWDEYLTQTSSVPAPEYCFGTKSGIDGIAVDMKLEAVHPMDDGEIHAASIFRIVEHLMGVELLSTGERVWYSQSSEQLFPVGWCETNGHELRAARARGAREAEAAAREGGGGGEPSPAREVLQQEEWCERIYFNYKCYAGPVISRNKLAQLPKHVGPGPLPLVLKEVLNMMISASYKPAKMLKDWESEGDADESMRLERLKAKLKTSTYHAYVQVATRSEQVAAFCRDMCVKMQACPYLFGPIEFTGPCPETCQLVDKCRFQLGGERRGRGRAAGRRRRKGAHFMTVRAQERRAALGPGGGGREPDSANESDNSAASTPRASEPGTRPPSPGARASSPGARPPSPGARAPSPGARPPSPGARPPSPGARPPSPGARPPSPGARPPSPGARPRSPERDPPAVRRRHRRHDYPKLEMKTRGAKLPNFARQIKEGHWNKKDADTMYGRSCVPPKRSADTDSERGSSSGGSKRRAISDVSDGDEPELARLRSSPPGAPPADPSRWSAQHVHDYLAGGDCAQLADALRDQRVDGAALLQLNLPTLLEFMHVRREYALRLCRHVAALKWHYIVNVQERGAE